MCGAAPFWVVRAHLPPPPHTHLLVSRAAATICLRRRSAYLEVPMMPRLGEGMR